MMPHYALFAYALIYGAIVPLGLPLVLIADRLFPGNKDVEEAIWGVTVLGGVALLFRLAK